MDSIVRMNFPHAISGQEKAVEERHALPNRQMQRRRSLQAMKKRPKDQREG
jgi:hypothetical protein